MSAESPSLVRSFRVGKRTCTLTLRKPVVGMVLHSTAEWSPEPPQRLSRRELREYREGRNAVFAEFAQITGLRTLLVEV